MSAGGRGPDSSFHNRLVNRITEIRLAIDLGEIRTPTAFRAALQKDGIFRVDDPRVIEACRLADLNRWLIEPPEA